MKIISAPFGNYLRFKDWVSTVGTFTPNYRGGFWRRVWRCARTLRYDRKRQGWVNRLGLPNPGIDWLSSRPHKAVGKIVSIGLAKEDTYRATMHLLAECKKLDPLFFELNVSCPNEDRGVPSPKFIAIVSGNFDVEKLIVKLPPYKDDAMELVSCSISYGIRRFHCCNTILTDRGGLSGSSLVELVCPIIRDIKREYPQANVIAGGGVTGQDVVDLYRSMGADHIAVGSAWLNPLNWRRLRRIVVQTELGES